MPPVPAAELKTLVKQAFAQALGIKGFGYICAAFTLCVFAALIARFGVSLGIVVLAAVAVVSFALLLIVVVQATKLSARRLALPTQIVVWVVTSCFVVTLICILTSAFLDNPLPIRGWIIVQLGTHSNKVELVKEITAEHIAAPVSARTIKEIIISETDTPPNQSTIQIADFLTKSRPNVGYHFIVGRSGMLYPFADLNQRLAHTRGHNDDSIAIGLEHQAGESFPPEQIKGLTSLLINLAHRFAVPPDQIFSKQQLDPNSPRDITNYIDQIRGAVRKSPNT